jgi:hypothetical protein
MTQPHQSDATTGGRALLIARARTAWAKTFGPGSCVILCHRYAEALSKVDEKSLERAEELRFLIESDHRRQHGTAALAMELTEHLDRDAARTDDDALVAYQDKWNRRLLRLQRAHPQRWRVPGLSEVEVRDALTLRLIEAVKIEPMTLAKYQRAGKEWGLLVAQQHVRCLRKSFGLGAIVCDFNRVQLMQQAPSVEEFTLACEGEARRHRARHRAELTLTRQQSQWLGALKASANAGGFFQSTNEPNVSAASRMLGKHRSSALRAYRDLQLHFKTELNKD